MQRVLLISMLLFGSMSAGPSFLQGDLNQSAAYADTWTSKDDKALIYVMGRTVCDAVIKFEQGDSVGAQKGFNSAQGIAREFGLTLPPLPTTRGADAKKQLDWAADYSLGRMKPFYDEVASRYKIDDSLICQLGCKTALLRMMYEPGEEMSIIVGKLLERDAPTVLPKRAWKPLSDAIKAKKPKSEVLKLLDDMDAICSVHDAYTIPVSGLSVRGAVVQQRLFGSGGASGASGAPSGKDSPVSAPVSAPSNRSGSPGKTLLTRAHKFDLYNYGRFTAMVCNMSAMPSMFAQNQVDEVYGFLVGTSKAYQLPLLPQPKRTGNSQADARESTQFAMKMMHDVEPVLETKYGVTERFIFDIGCKAHLLQTLYDQKAPKVPATEANLNDPSKKISMTEALVLVFELHGEEAMPERIWKPLQSAINRRAPDKEVIRLVTEMDSQVEAWFLPKGTAPRN